jgi:GntR family transcriptional regulator
VEKISDTFSEYQRIGLKKDTPTPLYFQLYGLLKNAILNGTLCKGVKMPTEQQLSEAFDVSRITAKRAMDELAAENLVERHRGKGTHVIYEYSPQPVKAPLVGMLQEIESMARHSDVRVLACERSQVPADIREELKLDGGTKALHLVRVRVRDDQAFGFYDSWTTGLSDNIDASDLENAPRLEIFRKQGLDISHVTQTISAVAATDELARALDTEVGAPLISLIRRSFDNSSGEEALVDYLQVYYHPERFQYRMDLKMDEVKP